MAGPKAKEAGHSLEARFHGVLHFLSPLHPNSISAEYPRKELPGQAGNNRLTKSPNK